MAEFLKNLYNIDQNFTVVADGDELGLGERRLKLVTTPMVHWPETMMSYEQKAKILFSGDAFGGFGSLDGGIFDDTVDIEFYESEILRYFFNIVGKFAPMVQKAITKLKGLDIQIVASTHGPVWRSRPDRIIELYDRWSRHQPEQGVVVAYGSMYGNSEKMMESIVLGLAQEGLRTVRVHDVSKSHNSFIISDIWRYRGLILDSPTYDARLLPQAESLVSLLADKMLRNRCVGVFGSCGWSGGAVKSLREFVTRSGLELVEPVIEARFAPNQEQLEKCIELGRRVASIVLRGTAN